LVGADKVLFGSDYPFEMLDEAGPARVKQLSSLAEDEIEAILGRNAQHLLQERRCLTLLN